MQMLKLFNAILFVTLFNVSDCIAARKDSADQQEKVEFDGYLKAIQEITNVTPHANAHFFSDERPLFPPNKKEGKKFFLDFTKHQAKEGYSAFTTPWEDVKESIKTKANEINRKVNNQATTYTVDFKDPIPAYKITNIAFPNDDLEEECNKDNIEKMDNSNSNFLNDPSKITQKDQRTKLQKFNDCLKKITYTTQEHGVKQARFIVAQEKPNEIKTAYPLI